MAWHEPVARTVTLCTLAFCPLLVSSLHTFPLHTRSQIHKRQVISARMESAVLSLRAPPYLQTFPDISKGLQVGSARPTLEPQIFNNNFHKSWCLLAGRKNPRASHPWTYGAWAGRELPFHRRRSKLGEGKTFCSRSSSHGSAKLVVKLKSSL